MAYVATSWVNGTTALNQTHMNNIETEYTQAITSFERDLFTAFVFSGLVASKDISVANQLDVTAGIAFLVQSDSTLQRVAPVSSTQVTATPSTTYYLFLKNDGTWSWGTSASGPANSLAICQATTDASGNILVVTDERNLNTTLFTSMLGVLTLAAPSGVTAPSFHSTGATTYSIFDADSLYDALAIRAINHTYWGTLGWGDASFGSGAGLYAYDQQGGGMVFSGGTKLGIVFGGNATLKTLIFGDVVSASQSQLYFVSANHAATLTTPQAGGTALGIDFQVWTGSAGAVPFSIGGQFGAASSWIDSSGNLHGGVGMALPTDRSGTATSVEIYTGSGTPSGDGVTTPRTGAIWIKA